MIVTHCDEWSGLINFSSATQNAYLSFRSLDLDGSYSQSRFIRIRLFQLLLWICAVFGIVQVLFVLQRQKIVLQFFFQFCEPIPNTLGPLHNTTADFCSWRLATQKILASCRVSVILLPIGIDYSTQYLPLNSKN